MTRVSFDIPDTLHADAVQVAAEMGLEVDALARHAFEDALAEYQKARESDLDEPTNVTALPGYAHLADTELQGSEPWLTTGIPDPLDNHPAT